MSNQPNPQARLTEVTQAANRALKAAALENLPRTLASLTAQVTGLPAELQRARSRGYVFANYLEQKLAVLAKQWEAQRLEAQKTLTTEGEFLRPLRHEVEALIATAQSQASNPMLLLMSLTKLEKTASDLENQAKTVENRIKDRIRTLERDIQQTHEQLQDIHHMLDLRDGASFSFNNGENVYLTAQGEWVATGKGSQDPDGTLYLTDQRLIFEQNEKTGKTLGLFGGKHTQGIQWEVALPLIEKVEAENKGLFGGKDMLHFTLGAGAPHPRITVEVKGKAKCKFWAAQIERMARGETKDERAIAPDEETLKEIKSETSECHVCGGTLPQLSGGQQVTCVYCGAVITL